MICMVIHMVTPRKPSGWEHDLHGDSHAVCHLHGELLFWSNHVHGESFRGLKRVPKGSQEVSRKSQEAFQTPRDFQETSKRAPTGSISAKPVVQRALGAFGPQSELRNT